MRFAGKADSYRQVADRATVVSLPSTAPGRPTRRERWRIMSEIWKKSLQALRLRFQAGGEQFRKLQCAIAQVDQSEDRERRFGKLRFILDKLSAPRESFSLFASWPIDDSLDHVFGCHGDGGRQFWNLAEHGGWILGNPESLDLQHILLVDSVARSNLAGFWVSTLFHAAWSCIPGAMLRACRNHFDETERTYASALPDNPFCASCELIDLLLSGRAEECAGRDVAVSTAGFRSCQDLAREHKLSVGALTKRLERWRRKNGEGWIEVPQSDRRRNEARFLYSPKAVAEVLTSKRPVG